MQLWTQFFGLRSQRPLLLSGKGEKELVALADGEVVLEVMLSTCSPASMEVRLLDEDGSEVWFNGRTEAVSYIKASSNIFD